MSRARAKAAVALLMALSAPLWASQPSASPPSLQASAAVLIDAQTGAVLFCKASDQPRPVASTTKIMTALLALELGRLDDPVTISARAAQVSGSSLHLQPGDVVLMEDLLAALLVESANDAAIAIAEHLAGSVEAFARDMNLRASQLGAAHTHFVNPHGLHDPEHYGSAYDLALVTCEAMKHPRFRQLVGAKTAEITLPEAADGRRKLVNHNKVLWRSQFADGVKTGYVNESGPCLVASATRDGWQLIAVLLDSPEVYEECLRLLDYGFSSYRRRAYARSGDALGRVRVRGSIKRSLPALCQETLATVAGPGLPDEPAHLEVTLKTLRAPVSRGDPAGEARLIAHRRTLACSPLIAGESASRSTFIIVSLWVVRALLLLLLMALLARTYAKALKAHRCCGAGLSPQGDRPDPRRPRSH